MQSQARIGAIAPAFKHALLLATTAVAALLLIAAPSEAASGGIGGGGGSAGQSKDDGGAAGSGDGSKGGRGSKAGGAYADAKLLHNGKAVAPASAPRRVKRAIAAANEIRRTKYQWGGGHAAFKSRGYDCSGAVSDLLHGARMLKSPLASGGLESWGRKRAGKWITVYANAGHTYAVVAGLRWDTSGGPGPRWHEDMRSRSGYRVRHYRGY